MLSVRPEITGFSPQKDGFQVHEQVHVHVPIFQKAPTRFRDEPEKPAIPCIKPLALL